MAIKNIFKKKQWKADYEAGRDAFNAGQFKAAETHLKSAMIKAIELDDASYGDTCLLLGQTMRRLERFEEALELTEKSFNYYIGFFGANDARTVSAHLSLVLADPQRCHADGSLREASYLKAVEQFGVRSWQVVRTAALALPHLGSAEREKALGQVQEAMTYALGEGRKELGAWPAVAEEFALELSRLGYTDLAARFMSSQLRVHEERFGERSEPASLTRLTLGEFYLRSGDWAKAEKALTLALEQLKLKHGPKSDLVRRGTVHLGQALARQGRLGQAAPYLTESLETLRADQGTERLEALVWLLEYKCMISATDAERGALWRELEMVWEANPSELARTRIFQGFTAAQRRLQEAWELAAADRFLQAVLNRVRQWRGPHHPDVAACMMDLGACAALREDDTKAMSYAEQSLALDEGVDNLIRSVALYGELGERDRAVQSAKLALRLVRSYSPGLEQGRRQAGFAAALLKAGDSEGAVEQAQAALEQLPEGEKPPVQLLLAEAGVLDGRWAEAEQLYQRSLAQLTEPVGRARAYLQYAYLLGLTGRFPEMTEALHEVESLSSLRREHPVLMGAKAMASQGAYYAGNIYQGKEERDVVFAFLRKGQHQQTRRALSILTLLDPFGPDEYGTELDVGTQILAASRFPEAVCAVFPVKDVACMGLRHLTRALFFHGQEDLARERLAQYKERFSKAYGSLSNPLASNLHLCAASLGSNSSERVEELEAARRGLRELGGRHVNLFPTLSLLAEQYIEAGAVEKAKVTLAEALAIRKSSRLKEWLETLGRGQLPVLGGDPGSREVTSVGISEASNPYETVTQPPEPALVTEPVAASSGPLVSESGEFVIPVPAPAPALGRPVGYQEPPRTEDETPPAPLRVPPLPEGFSNASVEDSGTVVAYGGASEVAKLSMAAALAERDEPPSEAEVDAFLDEVTARFGNDRRARRDAQLLLALLFPDGAELALKLWNEALADVFMEDFETLLQLENRARDANSSALVLAALQRRLQDEVGRYGEQATESIDTLTRMARAFENRGQLEEAYQRVMLTCEILRSWFGARSRRLLEPLAHLIRLSEKRDDVPAALAHHLERHHLLEQGQSTPEELFSSRIGLLPIRALLGQVTELMEEAAKSQSELASLGANAASEFAQVLLPTALRLERLHWRVQEAVRLLEMALAVVPESEVSLLCRLQVAFAECQARREYRSQAETLRKRTMDRVSSLESESRAEILHEMAESCLRVRELAAAREIAERVLEERIADGGRKDQWAGRALLVLAEADLRSYRLEGTETAIAMSRPSLEGSPFWAKALQLKCQAEFFLGREEEAFAILDGLVGAEALDLRLPLAVWRGQAEALCSELESSQPTLLQQRWSALERAPLDEAVSILEFLARAGKVRLLQSGLDRIEGRLTSLLSTDVRTARTNLLRATLMLWEGRWPEAEALLQRVLEVLPADRVEMPEGLSMLTVRGPLVQVLLAQGKVKPAELQARDGAAEAAETLGEEDIRSIAFRAYTAFCAAARGDQEESMVILDEILAPLQDRLGETHVLLRDLYRGLSQAFSEQDDLESARLTAEEALRIDKESRGLSLHLIEDLHLLSGIERDGGDPAEARNLLDTALELGAQALPEHHPYRLRLETERHDLGREDEERQDALLAPSAPENDEEEGEPSIDGWEVVSDQPSQDASSEVEAEEAPLFEGPLFVDEIPGEASDSGEDFVEDSLFETPLVDYVGERNGDSGELFVSQEETVEPADLELELSEEELAEEAAAELELSEEELSEEELAEEVATELELSEEELVEQAAAELDFSEEPSLDGLEPSEPEASLETEPSSEAPVEEEELELSEEERAEEAAAELELSREEALTTTDPGELESVEESPVESEPASDGTESSLQEPAEEASSEPSSPLFQASTSYSAGPRDSSASVEMVIDFPPVPYRVPNLSEVVEPALSQSSQDDQEPGVQAEEGQPAPAAAPEVTDMPLAPAVTVSLETMAAQQDPEASLLPLAPVFFLPVPWHEASEATVDDEFLTLHARFQEAFGSDGSWREVVNEAVSAVRLSPTPAGGFFLFQVGSELERANRLHTADLCLATAIELLESGPAFGAACHLAGRVAGRRGELRRALDYFERAAELADETELAILKIDAAECHLGLGRPEEALIGFEEVFSYLNEEVPKVQSMAVQAKMAQIHLLIGDPDSSQALAEDVLERLSPKNDGTYRVLARILLSRAFARLGRHELALELAEQAWEGAKPWSSKRSEGRRVAISNLVDLYSLVGRFGDAEAMVRESGLAGWGLAESELLLRAGHVACALGKLDAARSYLRLGQSFLTRFRSPALWRSSFLELEAELALQQGDPGRADQLSRQALTLFEQEATGPVDRSRHLVRAARIAGALGELSRARTLIEEAYSLRDLHLGTGHPHTESVEGLSAVFAS